MLVTDAMCKIVTKIFVSFAQCVCMILQVKDFFPWLLGKLRLGLFVFCGKGAQIIGCGGGAGTLVRVN